MACTGWVKVFGIWRQHDAAWVKVFGTWRVISECWTKKDGQWLSDDTDPPLAPGVYVLSGSVQIQLPVGSAVLTSFNTDAYRGRITEVRARVSWTSRGSMSCDVYGRFSNTFYRTIASDIQWANRTIDHRLDTFSGNVLPQFNSGSAVGYQLQMIPPDGNSFNPTQFVTNAQLVLTIV